MTDFEQLPGTDTLEPTDELVIVRAGRPMRTTAPELQDVVGRLRLTQNATYHVATTGNDETGDGSASAPWATLQHAFDWVGQNIEFSGYYVTIQIADGTYVGVEFVYQSTPRNYPGLVYFHGNAANPENVIITRVRANFGCFHFNAEMSGLNLVFNNLTFHNASGGAYGLWLGYGGNVAMLGYDPEYNAAGTVRFTGAFSTAVVSVWFATVEVYGNIVVASTGNFGRMYLATGGGKMDVVPDTEVLGTLTVTSEFFRVDELSDCNYSGPPDSGTVTGKKYNVTGNSYLGGSTNVPGSVAGTTGTGGQAV